MASGGEENDNEKNEETEKESEDSEELSNVEKIRRYLASKLGFLDSDDSETEDAAIPKILDEVSVDGIVDYIKTKKCSNIITLAGAGISTSAGIPDFRSPGSGLYHNLQKYNLPDPQAIFEIGFFRQNPQPFFTLAKELFPSLFKPTVCHYFIRLLNEKGLLLRHFTQNIDTLERVAGLPGDKIVEAHGNFFTSHCLDCKATYPLEWMKEQIFSDNVPVCTECNGIVKPDIIFFGENMPVNYFFRTQKDFPKCDMLIIMGSSLAVQPFASLIDNVPKTVPRLLINRERAGEKSSVMKLFGISCGLDFDSEKNSRDVAWLGDCDEGCQMLADKLGWGDELRKMVEEEHRKLDEEKKKEEAKKAKEESKEEKEVKNVKEDTEEDHEDQQEHKDNIQSSI